MSHSTVDANSRTLSQQPGWFKVALLAGGIAVASLGFFIHQTQNPRSTTAVAEVNPVELERRSPLEDFILTDAGGGTIEVSDLRGKVVILAFWASWCAPCLVELPALDKIQKKFRDRGLEVLAINTEENSQEGNEDDHLGKSFARSFWPQHQLTLASYFDSKGEMVRHLEVNHLPTNLVLDRKGRLVFSVTGASDWTSPATLDLIEGLLLETDH